MAHRSDGNEWTLKDAASSPAAFSATGSAPRAPTSNSTDIPSATTFTPGSQGTLGASSHLREQIVSIVRIQLKY